MNPTNYQLAMQRMRDDLRERAENARRARLHRAALARRTKAKRGGPR